MASHESPPREAALERAAAPVQKLPTASPSDHGVDRKPRDGIALCLSGGGFRAMLFHLGALWRLNELGYLRRLDRISSVSGGSITAGVLGHAWNTLSFDGAQHVATNFERQVVDPIRRLGERTIDWKAILLGMLLPGTPGDHVASAYRRHVFGGMTLQELPDNPQFVFNATNLQSGVLWRFSKAYLWDYRVGEVKLPRTELASAVAASSAFPPFLSPYVLRFDDSDFVPGSGDDLQRPPFTSRAVLADGGVYDNLGLETVWKSYLTVLVSDGGGHLKPEKRPWHNWLLQGIRVGNVIDNQVRSLRKRQVIDGYQAELRKGTYWGIRSQVADYRLADALDCPPERTARLAELSTRLARISSPDQERLINWGYAICDTAMRRHVETGVAAPPGFPYPNAGI